jgi:hypothetical protein
MNAPKAVIILVPVAPGDRGVWRRSKPEDRRGHKAVRPTEPWRPARSIPAQLDRDELRRRVEQFREGHRQQVEAVLAAGRDFRAALRAA